MSSSRWSVRLAVESKVAGPISQAMLAAVGRGVPVYQMSLSDHDPDDEDGLDALTFELEASDPRQARLDAQYLLEKVLGAAGLRKHQARVIWIAPVLDSERSSHRFLGMARNLLDDEETADLAVVAAQIHLELHIKALVADAVADDPSPLRAVLVDHDSNSWGPQARNVQVLLNALFGVNVKRDYPRWSDYVDHNKRRNAIAHRGQTVSEDDARASLDVITDLWTWLNNAAGATRKP